MSTIKVLDHGFVKLRNLAGPTRRVCKTEGLVGNDRLEDILDGLRDFDADDIDPAQAARMSFEQMDTERTYDQDMKLNGYLLKNEHFSPFEMIVVWLEFKCPIFVDRQFVRHGTIRRNESSGRYITLPAEWYIPEVVGGKPVGGAKQGQSDTLDDETQEAFKAALRYSCQRDYDLYIKAMDSGVAAEHARMFLHVNHYVHYIAKVDLRNLFNFLRLRVHSHAQIEARKYGEAIIQLLTPHIPGLMGLFEQHVRIKE